MFIIQLIFLSFFSFTFLPDGTASLLFSNLAKSLFQVMLKDVEEMVRLNPVSVPSGFTKLGYPILYFPDCAAFSDIMESDLHLLFKYYLSVVPRTEQQGRRH